MVAIGIDLGTTYSCVAVYNRGVVEIICNEEGNRTTPSYVAFSPTQRLIGNSAKNQAAANPVNTVFSVKRLIGKRYDDFGVQLDIPHLPFRVLNDNGKPKIVVEHLGAKKRLAPEEISGMLLSRLKELAESYYGGKITDAVITVPAYFSDAQRLATRAAGVIAGFNILRILNEPTAAALAYGVEKQLKGEKNIFIYDLGGGTFDVTVLKIKGTVFEVKSTAGNTRLGGEDFDNRLVAYFAQDYENKYGRSIVSSPKALRRLRTAAERAKRYLTSATEAFVDVEALDGIDYQGKVTREMFEELCSDLFKDTLKPVIQALQDARIPKNHIHEVVLVGGSTRIPKIRIMLQDFFDGKVVNTSINPDEAVAYGAAIQAAVLSGKPNQKAIQDIFLTDIVPLSLGIETARGLMYKVVEKNTPIPCRMTKDITTLEDNQTIMTVEVFEGERALTKDNNLLGVFELSGIPAAPRGVPKIDVIFDIDANGILTVVAEDRSTGKTKGIIIDNNTRLKSDEVERMINVAKLFKEQDNEMKLCFEARNDLESYVFTVKRRLIDFPNSDVSAVEDCEAAMKWLDDNTDKTIKDYRSKLIEVMNRFSNVLKNMESRKRKMAELEEYERATIEALLDFD